METSQEKLFDRIFRPHKGREGHKKWFEIVHWVVMSVFEPFNPHIQGHPPELSDSVKLLLSDAKRHRFEIDHVLKSID